MSYRKISCDPLAINASSESIVKCGIQLGKSHLQFCQSAVKTNASVTMIIWVNKMTIDELQSLRDNKETSKEILPRYTKEGEVAARSFHCLNYKGIRLGLSEAMQCLQFNQQNFPPMIKGEEKEGTLYWVLLEILGDIKLCVALSNQSGLEDDAALFTAKSANKQEIKIGVTELGAKIGDFQKVYINHHINRTEDYQNITDLIREKYKKIWYLTQVKAPPIATSKHNSWR